MIKIIQGTTPTIKYTFNTITTTEVTAAYLTVKQENEVIIKKDITAANFGAKDISWTLTQEETLRLQTHTDATMLCNWKLTDGTRGTSKEEKVYPTENHITEVI